MSQKVFQIAVIGEGFVGKTSLLRSYFNEDFCDTHVQSLCDKEIFDIKIDDEIHKIKLIDTDGNFKFEFADVDCFIVCYSIENRLSFANVRNKWFERMKKSPKWPVPVVVVATKTDLRDELPNTPFLTLSDGILLCEDINGKKFIETSSKEGRNANKVIEIAVRALLPEKIVIEVEKNHQKAINEEEKPSQGCCPC